MNASDLSALKYLQQNTNISCKINDLNIYDNQIIITDGNRVELIDPLEITHTFFITNFSSISHVFNIKFSS